MRCIIIGAGLFGSVVARKLAEKGADVLVLERRSHIAGNLYDYYDENNLLVQKYGPHSFFTYDKTVPEYVSLFSEIMDCFPECCTMINGQLLPMPFNFKAIDMMYPSLEAETLKIRLLDYFNNEEYITVPELIHAQDPIIRQYGQTIYEQEYRPYSAKQWGRPIQSIDPSIFSRVPVYLSYKKEYQRHPYQFIPIGGFTLFIQRLLDHPNISVETNVDGLTRLIVDPIQKKMFFDGTEISFPIIYTGAIDRLFQYCYGSLPYRSLYFEWETLPIESFQPTAIVAYPQDPAITRITEYTKLPKQILLGKTVIAKEYPVEYNSTASVGNEPYYPIDTEESRQLFIRYQNIANIPNLYLGGRLAEYRYYNMDHIINRALDLCENIILT